MRKFEKHMRMVKCGDATYQSIGTEWRGMYGVPIACVIDGDYISCTVYQIIKGYHKVRHNEYISANRLNETEIALLEKVGLSYNGVWIYRQEVE